MSVELVLVAGTDLDVVNAARVSLNRESQTLTDRDRGLIGRLMRDGHSSPFAQVWAKFRISCSIGCSRQVARHGHYLELNEYSTRYSEMPDDFVMPTLKRQIGKSMDYQFGAMEITGAMAAEQAVSLAYQDAYRTYRELLNYGLSREDARSVLPLGTKTHLIAASHLKGWFRFLAQRTDPHAQDEIRGIATEIERHLAEAFPVSVLAWIENGRRAL